MNKIFVGIIIGIVLSTIETSFFSSFYSFFSLTPFVFLVSVYLLQHHNISSAVIWMIVHGIILDMTQMGTIPFLTIVYTITALVAFISSKRIFSNRSFYGVFACTLTSFFTLIFVQMIIVWIRSFGERKFLDMYLWKDLELQLVLVIIFMPILFSFAKYIKAILEKSLLIPKAKRTY